MPETEVASAFVTIGAKTEKLKRAFRESEQITRASLAQMGRGMGDFAARFGGKLGIGLGGGFAAAAAAIVSAGITVSGSLSNVAQRSGELGVSFLEQMVIIDRFLASAKKVTPITREQSLAMGALGLQFGFAGKRLEQLLDASTGLAEGFGTPTEAMQALIDSLVRGSDLLKFGVKATGTPKQVFRAGETIGAARREAQAERGTLRPGDFLRGVKAEIERTLAETAEAAFRDADKTPLSKAQRKREEAIRDLPSFTPTSGSDRFKERFRVWIGSGDAKIPPPVPPPPALRFQREADFFDTRAFGETGIEAEDRQTRGTRAAGGGGTFKAESDDLGTKMQELKTAVENNTRALGPDSPKMMEQP